MERAQARGQAVVVRAAVALALPALYEAVERGNVARPSTSRPTRCWSGRSRTSSSGLRDRPSHALLVRYRSVQHQAAAWDRPRRVIAKVEHHLGALFPRVGVIVTRLTGTNRAVVHCYNQRGTAEQWSREGTETAIWTRLSCHGLRANEVRWLLGVIA